MRIKIQEEMKSHVDWKGFRAAKKRISSFIFLTKEKKHH